MMTIATRWTRKELTEKEQLTIVFKRTLKDMIRRVVGINLNPVGFDVPQVELVNIVRETTNTLLKEVSIRTPLK